MAIAHEIAAAEVEREVAALTHPDEGRGVRWDLVHERHARDAYDWLEDASSVEALKRLRALAVAG